MTGLTDEQVNERIAEGKVNADENPNTRTYKQIVRENTLTFFNFLNLVLLVLVLMVGSYKNAFFVCIIIINTLIGIAQEIRAKKTIDKLAILTARKSVVIREGQKWTVPTEELVLDDVVCLKTGDQVPADACILEGSLEVNESLLTGESDNLPKSEGDELFSGSFVTSGEACCQIIHVGKDNYAAQITSEAKEFKRHNSELKNSLNAILKVISIIIVPLGALLFYKQYYIVGDTFRDSVVSMVAGVLGMIPEGLVLLTSVALTLGALVLANKKTLVQELYCIETLARVDTLCLDKTGTITKGEPVVTDILAAENVSGDELMQKAAALEKLSEHPLARAVVGYYSENYQTGDAQKDKNYEVSDFKAVAGNGLMGSLNGRKIIGGNMDYIKGYADVPETMKDSAEKVSQQGKTPMFFAEEADGDYRVLGIIAVADTVKEDSAEAISQLQSMGLSVVMLTGDNERTAKAIGEQVGVDRVIAGVRPDGKESVVRDLMQKGHVIMVGDGINDAPVLTISDIGVAMGGLGSDAAIEAADIVIMTDETSKISKAINLSKKTMRIVRENIIFAIFVKIAVLVLTAFGASTMWEAVFADVGVSVIAIINALRMLNIKKFE